MRIARILTYCMTMGSFALLLLMPKTSFAGDANSATSKGKVRTCPIVWREFKSLNSLNRGFIKIPRDGRQSFGWFMYRLFVDPGLKLCTWAQIRPGEYIQMPDRVRVSEEVHKHYSLIARAYTEIPEFKRAMNLLFENGSLANRFWPWIYFDIDKLTALSQKDRALLQTVSQLMQSALKRKDLDADIKAAISLIIALTTGNDFQKDAVSLQQLAQIPNSYPKQKIITFISYYYRYEALHRRHRYAEMQNIIKKKEAWMDDPSLDGTDAYYAFKSILPQMKK